MHSYFDRSIIIKKMFILCPESSAKTFYIPTFFLSWYIIILFIYSFIEKINKSKYVLR